MGLRLLIACLLLGVPLLAQDLPKPVLKVTRVEEATARNGKVFVVYRFEVTNWKDFPDELFSPAPQLLPVD